MERKNKRYGKPRKLLGKRNKCFICGISLRHDNKIETCRKHRTKSPIVKKKYKEYHIANREKIRKIVTEYTKKNKDKKREYDKIYNQKNKKRRRPYFAKYKREREATDPLYKLKNRLRRRIWNLFKKDIKQKTTLELLGTDFETIKKYLENQFTKGMTWKNHGEWHIDHIIPLVSAKTEEEMEKLCHYTNLQPLWASDNLKKGKSML